jgi:hypothetical protein
MAAFGDAFHRSIFSETLRMTIIKIRIMTKRISYLLLGVLLLTSSSVIAQKQSWISVDARFESSKYNDNSQIIGISYENRLNRTWGYEAGIHWEGEDVSDYQESMNFLSLSGLVKWHNLYFTISAGPDVSFYIGQEYSVKPMSAQRGNPTTTVCAVVIKASRNFQLGKNWSLEPEFYVKPVLNYSFVGVGLGVRVKYRL